MNDANDATHNQVVSYLLQRVEDYYGVVILASNLKSNLDDALPGASNRSSTSPCRSRRIAIFFGKNAFSEKTGLDGDVRLKEIANRYELSAAPIINVVRYATLMAVRGGSTVIDSSELERGIRKELQKEGRTS